MRANRIFLGILVMLLAAVTVSYAVGFLAYLNIKPNSPSIWRQAHKEVVEPYYPEEPEPVDLYAPVWSCFDPDRVSGAKLRTFQQREDAFAEFEPEQCYETVSPKAAEIRQTLNEIRYNGELIDLNVEYRDDVQERAIELAAEKKRKYRQELVDWSQIISGFSVPIGGLIGFLLTLHFRRKPEAKTN